MLALCVSLVALHGRELTRRQLGGAAGSALAAGLLPPAARAAVSPDEMRTSANIDGYTALTGQPGSSLGAGAISGKSRPRTGVCLLEPVATVGSAAGGGKTVTVQSLVALDGGVAATTRFESPYPLAQGFYYDVETRSREGDGAFLLVERLPAGATLDTVDGAWLLSTVFASTGRFGAYGVPTDVRLLADSFADERGAAAAGGASGGRGGGARDQPRLRLVEVSFAALTPGGSEQRRHAMISALQPRGSEDAMLLVGGTSELRWKKEGTADALRRLVRSFELDGTRATKIGRALRNDYRVAEGTLFP
ncbi:hypothetical protein KFE25_011178 [Diacronema lutheri]|uniref:Uncharacterized protein n=1 Tax=Diacronema lutheri TaxID=2081491 RepID=A0A8J5X7X0_DIALT|nr:hypothetical protein KFE25_011178 [Diacronema lutheri]